MAALALTFLLASSAVASPSRLNRRATDGPTPSGTVPADTVKDCTYWINAQAGDSCSSIESTYAIAESDFIQYNPSLGHPCNLKSGYSYCIEENYGQGPAPPSSNTPPPTSSTSSPVQTTTPPATTTPPGNANGPQPEQSGIASNCNNYYLVKSGDGCQAIVDSYGEFTLNDFYKWNPAVKNDCTGLQAGYYVCVGVPGSTSTKAVTSPTSAPGNPNGPQPEQSGIASNCNNYYKVKSGDGCQAIVDSYQTFTLQDFYKWNPAVKNDCTGLQAGYYVCVGVPGTPTTKPTTTTGPTGPPTQSGIIKSCTKYYEAVSGDTCDKIQQRFGTFTVDQFIQWNPAVKSDCTGLIAGDNYCVAIPGTPTTRPSPTPTAAPAPGPTQPGITSNCNKYAAGQSGDTCSVFASRNHISLQNLYNWNTVLGNNGQNCQTKFWANEYYCIGVK